MAGTDPQGRTSYRVELAASLSSLVATWWSSTFREDIVRSAGVDMGTTDSRLLWEIGARGPQRSGALAGLLDLGAPSISKGVARLAARGLVTLVKDPSDGRGVLVALTEEGTTVARQLYEVGDRMVAEVVSDWPEADARAFTELASRFSRDALAYASRLRARRAAAPGVTVDEAGGGG